MNVSLFLCIDIIQLFFLVLKILKINEKLIMNAGMIKRSLIVLTSIKSYCKNTIENKIRNDEIINPVFM